MTPNSINQDSSKPKLKESETVVTSKKSNLTAVKTPNKQDKMLTYIIYGVGVFFTLLVIGLVLYLMMPAKPKKPTEQTAPTQVASVAEPVATAPPPYLASLENNPQGWYFNAQPIDTLVEQAVDNAVVTSTYNHSGQIQSPSGATLGVNSPEFTALVSNLKATQKSELKQLYREEPRGAYQQIYHFDSVANKNVPISDPNEIMSIENQAKQDAVTKLNDAIMGLPAPIQQAQNEQEKPKVIDMTDEQRQQYLSLIQNLRDWNRRLQSENADLKKELAQQERGVTSIIQKLEDSPTANQRLRATMLPKSTGLTTEAVVGGRAWLRNVKTGALYSVEVGSILPNTELRVAELREDTGIVMVTRK